VRQAATSGSAAGSDEHQGHGLSGRFSPAQA
jgi:hypothetical protein